MNYSLGLYEKSMPAGLSWPQMLAAAGKAGFDRLEISIDESDARLSRLEWTKAERMDVLRAMEETGVPIRTMCLSAHRKYPFGSHDESIRKRSMQIMEQAIELACDLGIRVIQLAGYDVYYETGDALTRKYFAENLAASAALAAEKGVVLGFETMETSFMDTISKGMSYVSAIDSPYLTMYPDLGNLTNACYRYGSDIEMEIRGAKGHMAAMHLKETVENVYRDMDFGDGRVDFVQGIKTALDCNIRLFTAEFWHNGCEDWQGRLKRTNDFIRDKFAIAIGEMENA